jgi:hypothetical protein
MLPSSESERLAAALVEGRFVIDRPTFKFYSESATVSRSKRTPAFELAEAVEALWPLWNEEQSGRRTWNGGAIPRVTVWRRTTATGAVAAIVGSVESLASSVAGIAKDFHVELKLEDPETGLEGAAIPKGGNVKGTGIGLAMAHQIVRAHGGRLDPISRPGHGSRFTIWLPAQTEDHEV